MAKKKSVPSFETHPPCQEKFSVPGNPEGYPSTAKPITHHNISSHQGDAAVLNDISDCGPHGRPVYDDTLTPHITRSRTNGKG